MSRLELVRALGSYERPRISVAGGSDPSELKRIHLFLFTTDEEALCPSIPRTRRRVGSKRARWPSC